MVRALIYPEADIPEVNVPGHHRLPRRDLGLGLHVVGADGPNVDELLLDGQSCRLGALSPPLAAAIRIADREPQEKIGQAEEHDVPA